MNPAALFAELLLRPWQAEDELDDSKQLLYFPASQGYKYSFGESGMCVCVCWVVCACGCEACVLVHLTACAYDRAYVCGGGFLYVSMPPRVCGWMMTNCELS